MKICKKGHEHNKKECPICAKERAAKFLSKKGDGYWKEHRKKYKNYYKEWNLNNKDKKRELQKRYTRRVPTKEEARIIHLKRRYNLTLSEYNIMKESQGFKCDICKKTEAELGRELYVDHNHNTGKIRGLLCNNCNSALGFFKESINNLNNAKKYLKKYGDKEEKI